MKDIEIVVFNDKSWVRLTEYQKLKDRVEQLKNENETLKKQFENFLDKTIENNEQLIAKFDNIIDKI